MPSWVSCYLFCQHPIKTMGASFYSPQVGTWLTKESSPCDRCADKALICPYEHLSPQDCWVVYLPFRKSWCMIIQTCLRSQLIDSSINIYIQIEGNKKNEK